MMPQARSRKTLIQLQPFSTSAQKGRYALIYSAGRCVGVRLGFMDVYQRLLRAIVDSAGGRAECIS